MLSLVVPVYKNEASIPDLLDQVETLNLKLRGDFEVVFVIDGSPDQSYSLLQKRLPQCSFRSQLVLLSKNFGSFIAIRTGLQFGRGDRFAVMAADLQEPPEMVLEMNQRLLNDGIDVVIGVRGTRDDPLIAKILSRCFWSLYRRWVVPEMPSGGVDMFACTRSFRDVLLTLEEKHSSLVSQVFWLGFNRGVVTYQRQKRQYGKSSWTLNKKLSYFMDSVFSFTDLPVRLVIRLGAIGSSMAIVLGLIVFIARLTGFITVPGYAMTVLLICFFSFLNLLGLGIVGSYAWRAYENTKQRPLSIPIKNEYFGESEYHEK